MTGINNNNKFVLSTPKTYEVKYVENENKQSKLSPAARNKVINRSGSNYLSESGGYGPCFKYFSNECNCGFGIIATLVDARGNSRVETIYPTNEQQVKDLEMRILNSYQGE